jgi:nucleotide-binding universal stress UspA family protein
MTLLAGFAPDGRGRAVLDLAAELARSLGEPLVVGAVIPSQWPPGLARVDAEYHEQLHRTAEEALANARRRLPDDVEASFVTHHARSAPAGLLELASEHDARLIVVGSASAGGPGHVTLGTTTSRLLHSSHVPVALAPRGFRAGAGVRVRRVTAAFSGADPELVLSTAAVAEGAGAPVRVASFAVRPHPPYTSGVGTEAEEEIVDEWEEAIRAAVPNGFPSVIGRGEDWDEALEDVEWDDGDVLVVGSSSIGPLAQVFLGSRANKIVRHSPVPVVVVPRSG